MKAKIVIVSAMALVFVLGNVSAIADNNSPAKQLERGRYLVATSGCNDCHTPGYMPSEGNVSIEQWLVGSPVGFQGSWGTTYPANLRLSLSKLTEQQWLIKARSPMLPPMPWFSLRAMNDDDLRAIYQFVRSLQPVGDATPANAAPGVAVNTPYFDFVPKNMNMTAQLEK